MLSAPQIGVSDIPKRLPPGRALLFPVGLGAALATFALVPAGGGQPEIARSFLGAGAVLLLGAIGLYLAANRAGRELSLGVAIKTPHWIQLCAQGTLMLYWGWHVSPVYANLALVLAQLMFAYGLEALIQWSKGERHDIGFGPFPIVLSINFFLWFRPEHYHWQFVIVALGYVAKSFIHWQREGRSRHIFNPSSFPLAVFSLVLILTGTTNTTFGLEIAQTLFNPPHIYLVIFLVAVPAQMLFGVATMTLASVVTAYVWGLVYFAATGTYYFRDAFVPIAVFLGMHLLFTDPATSPRTEQGRVMFGVLYAVFTIALAGVLEAVGAPTFYDKLLPIPILNTMVRRLDRLATVGFFRSLEPARLLAFTGITRPRIATASLWIATFIGISAAGGFGDDHPGQYLPFWDRACESGSERACEYVVATQELYCDRGSGWACNELGIRLATDRGDFAGARSEFERACALSFRPGCDNVLRMTAAGATTFAQAPPGIDDLPIVIRGSKGAVTERNPAALYALACERGWEHACEGPAENPAALTES